MTTFRWLSSLLPLAALIASAAAQQPAYRITGIVVGATTSSPVPQCHIVAVNTERDRNERAAPAGPGTPSGIGSGGERAPNRRFASRDSGVDTDAHGRFVLPVSGPGSWSLRASARGYRSQGFEQHESFFTSVVITDQAPTYDLTYRLIPDSTITGVVLDEAGEPVRQAQVSVYSLSRAGAGTLQASMTQGPMPRSNAMTDDRGRYEVTGLAPGNYRVSAQARPWYAANQPVRPPSPTATQQAASDLDPSLDVVYPLTWFPGTADENSAVTLTLHDGETREAGIQLVAIQAIHLRLPAPLPPTAASQGNRVPPQRGPQIERISGNGTFLPFSSTTDGQGHLDIGGLSPGLYRVQTPGENGEPGHSTVVEIASGSGRTVDLASAIAPTATVTLKIDGSPENENLPIIFTDATNSSRVFRTAGRGPGGFRAGIPPGAGDIQVQTSPSQPASPTGGQRSTKPSPRNSDPIAARPDRTIELPPGRYYVTQGGSNEIYLTGLALGKNEILGRVVTIPSGSSVLTLHIATGRATLNGVVTLGAASPSVGAMVLLVPITLNEPGAISILRRAQTSTDGSFHLDAVIPSQYILVAIDHGWGVNWNDPMTLTRYLSNGVPLDLRSSAPVKQDIAAQTP